MSQNSIYVGIDVDDMQGQLEKVREYFGGVHLKLCYEASYVGFSLQGTLKDRGYDCEVVAPSSIPRRAGKAVKTHRIRCGEPGAVREWLVDDRGDT